MGTSERFPDALRVLVQGFVQEDDLPAALRAQEYFAPDGVVDLPLVTPSVCSVSYIQPKLSVDLGQDARRLTLESGRIHGRVVVVGDESGDGRQVGQRGLARPQARDRLGPFVDRRRRRQRGSPNRQPPFGRRTVARPRRSSPCRKTRRSTMSPGAV